MDFPIFPWFSHGFRPFHRGYAPRGTQSVVAGLTAALWDLENAKVEDGASLGRSRVEKKEVKPR